MNSKLDDLERRLTQLRQLRLSILPPAELNEFEAHIDGIKSVLDELRAIASELETSKRH